MALDEVMGSAWEVKEGAIEELEVGDGHWMGLAIEPEIEAV